MRANCENCSAGIEVPYTMLGAPTRCPNCGQQTVPQVPDGTVLPLHGYALRFRDFQQLISQPASQDAVGRLLRRWYLYWLETTDDSIRIASQIEGEIDPIELHQRIQADSEKQYTLYQTAMSLWR